VRAAGVTSEQIGAARDPAEHLGSAAAFTRHALAAHRRRGTMAP
jgi:hypothetical protein